MTLSQLQITKIFTKANSIKYIQSLANLKLIPLSLLYVFSKSYLGFYKLRKVLFNSQLIFSLHWLKCQSSSIKLIKKVIYQLRCFEIKQTNKSPGLAFLLPKGRSFHSSTAGTNTQSIGSMGGLTNHSRNISFPLVMHTRYKLFYFFFSSFIFLTFFSFGFRYFFFSFFRSKQI